MKQRKRILTLIAVIFGICVIWFLSAYINNLVDNLKSNINNSHELFILLRKLPVQIASVFGVGVIFAIIILYLEKLSKHKIVEK